MPEPITEGWITTDAAQILTDYAQAYLRQLASQERIKARKVGRDWLIHQESLLAYKTQMEALGDQRHNPWREDLAEQGRGRWPRQEAEQGGKHMNIGLDVGYSATKAMVALDRRVSFPSAVGTPDKAQDGSVRLVA